MYSCILCKVVSINDEEGDKLPRHRNGTEQEKDDIDVQFLFKVLLEIPQYPGINLVLDGNLINADHLLLLKPDLVKWCDQCGIAIQQARKLYQQIRETTVKFRKIQRKIVDTIQNCILNDNASGFNEVENYKALWRKLCLHNEGRFNNFEFPFTVQDWMPIELQRDIDIKDENDEDQVDTEVADVQQQQILVIFPKDYNGLSEVKSPPRFSSEDEKDELEKDDEKQIIKIESNLNSSGLGHGDCKDNDNDPLATEKEVKSLQNYCTICKKSYKTKKYLKSHISVVHSVARLHRLKSFSTPTNFQCHAPHCQKYFKTSPSLLEHLRKTHPDIPRPSLKKLSILHKTHPDLYSKIVKNPITNLFQCPWNSGGVGVGDTDDKPICSKTSKCRRPIENHVRSKHLGETILYPCTWGHGCTRTFTAVENYNSHMDRHNGTPRWKCDLCDNQFYNRNLLVNHKEREHEDGKVNKPFNCQLCGKSFSCRDYLRNHKSTRCKKMARGIPEKKYPRLRPPPPPPQRKSERKECEICGKCVINLKQHMDHVHSFERNHMCHLCSKSFKSGKHLNEHLKRHEDIPSSGGAGGGGGKSDGVIRVPGPGKNKFQCGVKGCRLRFRRNELLERHMKAKHGENGEKEPEFKCQYCGKGFHLKMILKQHEENHENEGRDPFKCQVCGKGFRTMCYLKYHQRHTHKMKLEDRRKVSTR